MTEKIQNKSWECKYILKDNREATKIEKSIYRSYKLSEHFFNKIKPPFPLVMMFETSALCNIKCIMCPRKVITRSLAGNMSFDMFRKVLDQCAEHDPIVPCQITLHYSGEPLLNPELPRMIKYAKDVGIPFVRFNTNGVLLTERISRRLIDSGLDKMTVALEATKEIHNKTRLGSNYELVSENILRFMELKKQLSASKPALWIQMLTSNFTTEQDIIYGIKKWEDIVDYVEVTSIATIGGQVPDMGTIIDRTECDDIWILMGILWNGDVTVCCVDHDAQLKMGNVLESTVQEIWDKPEHDRLRELHKREDFSRLPQLCRNCIRELPWHKKLRRKARRTLRHIVREKLGFEKT